MRRRRLSGIALDVGGRRVGIDTEVHRVVTDSRLASRRALFVALPGARTDGHGFLHDAARRGAAAAIVARDRVPSRPPVPLMVVPDPGAALLALAVAERRALTASVVGITGSAGKTSTKDFLASIARLRYRTTASAASFNNQIGLPLTILRAGPSTEVLVCEIGAGVVGEIAELAAVARPSIGVVTNVGLAHVGTFGSPQAIARAKRELVESLPEGGVAALNADDPVVRRFGDGLPVRIVTYGRARGADVRAERIGVDRQGRARFLLRAAGDGEPVELPVSGRHMVLNACAAAAVATVLGCSLAECSVGLKGAKLQPGRMEAFDGADGLRVLHDAYNASPASVRAGLETATAMPGRTVAVLGPMAELGSLATREDRRVGRLIVRLGVARLVVVGTDATRIADGAVAAGMPRGAVTRCDDVEQAIVAVRGITRPGDLVFVKASRAAGLERVTEQLR